MVADVLGVQQRREPLEAAGADLGGGAQVPGDDQGRLVVEDVADGGGQPGEAGVELGVDLVAGIGVLPHQVATVAGQQPEPGVDVIEAGSIRPKPLTAARVIARRSVSSVLLPGSAARRNDLEASGWTTRASRPAATAARLIGAW